MTPPKKIKYKRVRVGDKETVTATYAPSPGQHEILGPIDSDHPHWDQILELLKKDDLAVVDLFAPIKKVELGFRELSDRLVVRDRHVFWDGDRVDNSLADQIIRFLEQGLDFEPLVKFYDKISQNPSTNSQRLLYNWLRTHKFTITPEGDILGFKGYNRQGDKLYSTHAGTASVNGEEFQKQKIPCKVGDIVTMARSSVDDNPAADCSAGLHVGTPSYARGFGDTRMAILINPRDVVSVPNYEAKKMRVCRYYVLGPQTDTEVGAIIRDAPEWEPKAGASVESSVKAKKPEAEVATPAPASKPKRPAAQPKSSILEDEKAKPAAKAKPKAAPRRGKTTERPSEKAMRLADEDQKAKESQPTETPTTVKINWNPKNLQKLMSCKTDEDFLKAFPGAKLNTLKDRARMERRRQKGAQPPT